MSMNAEAPTEEAGKRDWIVKRYGPITIVNQTVMYGGERGAICTVFIAAVPVWKGIAVGAGATEEIAVEALYGDLRL